jgi:hypothetical protein
MTLLYDKYTKAEANDLLKIARTKYRFGFIIAFLFGVAVVVAFFLGVSWVLQLSLLIFAIGFGLWAWWTAEYTRILIVDIAEAFS